MTSDVFRLLVTGSRNCAPDQAVLVGDMLDITCSRFLAARIRVVIVEGECRSGGVDAVARRWGLRAAGVDVESHPADWDRYGRAAGPIRNAEMVALGGNLCMAFPAPDSRGTWDCIRKAAGAGIPVQIYPLAMTEPAAA